MKCDISYEELAACQAGEATAARMEEIQRHLPHCAACRKRITALAEADGLLKQLTPYRPSHVSVLAVRRALSAELRQNETREILTLDEAAAFLRINPEEMEEIAEELPAFELAGQIRIRRTKLLEWIDQRESNYMRQTAAGWADRIAAIPIEEGRNR